MTQAPSLNFLQGTASNPSDFAGMQEDTFESNAGAAPVSDRQGSHGITPQLQYENI